MDLFTVDTVGDHNSSDENEDSKIEYSYDGLREHGDDSECSDEDDDEAEEIVEKETVNVDSNSNDNDDEANEEEYNFELYGGEL